MFMWTVFKVLVEFVMTLLVSYGFLAVRHAGSYLPDEGLNLHTCTGRQSLNPWTSWEVPVLLLSHRGL